MFSWLEDIFYGILDLPFLFVNLLVEAVNGWILMIAGLVGVIIAVLPGFPTLPTVPAEIASVVAYFLPVAGIMIGFATYITAWLTWRGVQLILRWMKVIG